MIELSERDGAVFPDKEEVINKVSCRQARPDLRFLSKALILTLCRLFRRLLMGRLFLCDGYLILELNHTAKRG